MDEEGTRGWVIGADADDWVTAGGIVAVDDSVPGCVDKDADKDGCVTAGEDDGSDVDGCVVGGEVRAEVVAGTKVIKFKLKNIRISYIIIFI